MIALQIATVISRIIRRGMGVASRSIHRGSFHLDIHIDCGAGMGRFLFKRDNNEGLVLYLLRVNLFDGAHDALKMPLLGDARHLRELLAVDGR